MIDVEQKKQSSGGLVLLLSSRDTSPPLGDVKRPPESAADALACLRMSADEDREAEAKHLHHPLPPVDHGHREDLPRGLS